MFNDPEIGAKGMSDNQYARQNSFVSIEKLQTYISTCKGTIGSSLWLFNGFAKCIKYNASAKLEDGGFEDFDSQKQKSFGTCQLHATLNSVRNCQKFFCLGNIIVPEPNWVGMR